MRLICAMLICMLCGFIPAMPFCMFLGMPFIMPPPPLAPTMSVRSLLNSSARQPSGSVAVIGTDNRKDTKHKGSHLLRAQKDSSSERER